MAALARSDRGEMMVQLAKARGGRRQGQAHRARPRRVRVVAPFDGVVIAGDLTRSLGAPVKRGEVLMTLALPSSTASWRRSRSAMWARSSRPAGALAFSALPWDALPVRVRRVAPMASVVDGENVFDVELSLEKSAHGLRPGLQGVACCGSAASRSSRAGAGRCSTGSASSGGGGADDMSESIFSPLWHRVAGLHPRLRAHAARAPAPAGETWYLLRDEASGRIHRVNASAYAFVGRCDGRRSVAELWEVLRIELGEQMPSQNEILSLLGRLFEGSLLEFEHSPDLKGRVPSPRKAERRRKIATPTRSRSASRWAIHRAPARAAVVSRAAALLLAGLVPVAAGGRRGARRGRSQRTGNRRGGVPVRPQPSSLILLWISYPLIKAVPSSPTASRCAAGAGRSEPSAWRFAADAGPLQDASEANAFRHRHQRVFVSAAGIMAELLIAAFALVLWLNIEDGLLKDFMLAAMTIGSLSTLLVNGNPLLRFDGYYVMIDAFGLPPTWRPGRSRQWWGTFVQRRLLGLRERAARRGAREWPHGCSPINRFRGFTAPFSRC